MRVIAGVDCHKSTHTVVFVDPIGEVRGSLTFPTTPEGYESAIVAAVKFGCSDWGVEGSGLYGYAFAIYLAAAGAKVYEVPGICTKRNRRASTQRGKSDDNDARAIAETVLREHGRLSEFRLATVQRALRLRTINEIASCASEQMQRIVCAVRRFFLVYLNCRET